MSEITRRDWLAVAGASYLAGALDLEAAQHVHNAVAGSASAPAAGDLPIHLRSAQLGDAFPPGATRWYQVYYRDPNPGFCPSATFNVSNGVRVGW